MRLQQEEQARTAESDARRSERLDGRISERSAVSARSPGCPASNMRKAEKKHFAIRYIKTTRYVLSRFVPHLRGEDVRERPGMSPLRRPGIYRTRDGHAAESVRLQGLRELCARMRGEGFSVSQADMGRCRNPSGPLLAGHGGPRPVLIRPGSGRALCPNERQRSAREDRPGSSPERRIRQISGIQRRLRTRTLRGEGALSPVQRDGQGGGRAGDGQLHRHPQASVSRHRRQRTKMYKKKQRQFHLIRHR